MNLSQISQLINNVPDFPIAGIQFKDISPILQDPEAFHSSIDLLAEKVAGLEFDEIIGIDARGFIFGAALAYKLNKGFVMARKDNKLPGELITQAFDYEYSKTALTLQKDRVQTGKKYLIVDDVLATGNTAKAVVQMLEKGEAVCAGVLIFIELTFLNGRETVRTTGLHDEQVFSLIQES